MYATSPPRHSFLLRNPRLEESDLSSPAVRSIGNNGVRLFVLL